jgi:hypothetical protein
VSRVYRPDPDRDYPPHNDPHTLRAWARTVAAVCLIVGLGLVAAECSEPTASAKAPPVRHVQP